MATHRQMTMDTVLATIVANGQARIWLIIEADKNVKNSTLI